MWHFYGGVACKFIGWRRALARGHMPLLGSSSHLTGGIFGTGMNGKEDEKGVEQDDVVGDGVSQNPQPHAMATVQLDRNASPHPCQDSRTAQARTSHKGATPASIPSEDGLQSHGGKPNRNSIQDHPQWCTHKGVS